MSDTPLDPSIAVSESGGFAELGLIEPLLKAVAEEGYTSPTPIQRQAIPVILKGSDIMAGSQTGTGKTASFALPMLQRLAPYASTSHSPAKHPVRALVLCPTRELAQQVEASIRTYGRHLPLRTACIYGGVGIRPQTDALRQGREIIVATPGRLLDHVEQKSVQFGQVEMLILDEADRMLDMGFIPDVQRILALLTKPHQSLLFSATFSKEIQKLADSMLRSPQLIEVARRNAIAETVVHQLHRVSAHDKRELLAHLLSHDQQTLVFVNTKFGASRLALYLRRRGHAAEAIHGDKTQNKRDAALEGFKNGAVTVLVATDVAGRGLDIDDLPNVVNFDLPNNPEDYVHRSGRTGRAGRVGRAISFMTAEDRLKINHIEKFIGRKLEVAVAEGFVPGSEPPAAPQHEQQSQSDQPKRRAGHRNSRRSRNPNNNPNRQEERPRRESRGPREQKPRHPKEERRHAAPRRAKAPRKETTARGNVDGFDFSKPYVPKTQPAPSPQPVTAPTSLRRQRRDVPSLLSNEK